MLRRPLTLQPSPRALITAGAILAATIAITLITHDQAKLGVSLAGACFFVPFAFANPQLALSLWLVTNLCAGLPVFGSAAHRLIYVIGLIWVGALAAGTEASQEAGETVVQLRRRQITLFVLFLVWILSTLLWAPDAGFASPDIQRYVMSAVIFGVVLTIVTEPDHVRYIAMAFVLGAVLSILSGVVTGGLHTDASTASTATSDEGRLRGGTSDPNYLAAAIVPALMLAGALAAQRGRPLLRAALIPAAMVLAIGLAATESRGGFIALVVVSIGALIIYKGRRMTIAAFMGVFVVGAAMWFVASPSSWQRVTHNTDKGSGRSDIWQVAWRVVETRPINGVGLSQFPVVSPDFIRQPGALSRADLLVNQHIVVHNSYLQLWAETGIVGLLLFLGVAFAAMQASLLAARRFDARGDPEMTAFARASMLAVAGSLAASFFLSNINDQRLWLLLGLGPALLAMSYRQENPAAARIPSR